MGRRPGRADRLAVRDSNKTGATIGFAAPVVMVNRQSTIVDYLRFRQAQASRPASAAANSARVPGSGTGIAPAPPVGA